MSGITEAVYAYRRGLDDAAGTMEEAAIERIEADLLKTLTSIWDENNPYSAQESQADYWTCVGAREVVAALAKHYDLEEDLKEHAPDAGRLM